MKLLDGHYGRTRGGEIFGPFRATEPGSACAYTAGGRGWTQDGMFDAVHGPHHLDIVNVAPTPIELRSAA